LAEAGPVRIASLLHSFGRPPWPLLFALAGGGLVLAAAGSGQATLPAFCGAAVRLLAGAGAIDMFGLLLDLNPPVWLALDWALMLLAMMPPLVGMPLMHVWRSSLRRRRPLAAGHFLLGYSAVWIAAGIPLLVLALTVQLAAGAAALAGALCGAALWSASPWQRLALNRGHRTRRIGLFGRSADRDCLSFGLVHGAWCVASCWPWMLVPLVAGSWHLAFMMLSAAIMLLERLAPPDAPRWRIPAVAAPIGRPRLLRWRRRGVAHG
jgi:hypothetical protein